MPPEQISGVVDHVIFNSEETGFCVLVVKISSGKITVIGHTPSASPGEYINADGEWIVDKRHGKQFKAETLRVTAPSTREGIEKYLGSGIVHGIGPHFAKKLVGAFGEKVFDVIEQKPTLLLKIDGIGKVRKEKIVSAWSDQKAVREIIIFLQSHGVSTARAFRIFKEYGSSAIDVVRENPYRLVMDISGIGFKSADQIAGNMGIEKTSMMRARAAPKNRSSTSPGKTLRRTANGQTPACQRKPNGNTPPAAGSEECSPGEIGGIDPRPTTPRTMSVRTCTPRTTINLSSTSTTAGQKS